MTKRIRYRHVTTERKNYDVYRQGYDNGVNYAYQKIEYEKDLAHKRNQKLVRKVKGLMLRIRELEKVLKDAGISHV